MAIYSKHLLRGMIHRFCFCHENGKPRKEEMRATLGGLSGCFQAIFAKYPEETLVLKTLQEERLSYGKLLKSNNHLAGLFFLYCVQKKSLNYFDFVLAFREQRKVKTCAGSMPTFLI